MNMDYALSEAINHSNTKGLTEVLLIYDIMCQYYVHHKKRMNDSPFLTIDEQIMILRAIGLFHVHGHQDSCFPRFAPTFIRGAGQVDGEILETLWSVLNHVAPQARGASLAHRAEILDNHMNDSNWKKLIKMGMSLCQSFNFF